MAESAEPNADDVELDRLSKSFRHASKQVLPSIVTIETLSGPRKTLRWAMRKGDSGGSQAATDGEHICPTCPVGHAMDGTGSGIIIDRRGYVLTCHHVIAGADTVYVRLSNGQRFVAEAIHTDAVTDLAVIQFKNNGDLPIARLGNADDLALGDWVISAGNPYGLGPSISAGVVSATDRELPDTPWMRLIQTDAASNPGNSGGALINVRGEVIGVSEGGYGATEGFHGIGFAIPINDAKRIAKKLIEHGKVRRGYLGCSTEPLTSSVAQHLGIEAGGGLIVCNVVPASPAENAGIVVGDVLTSFSGTSIRDRHGLQRKLEESEPGSRHEIIGIRQGRRIRLNVIVGQLPERIDYNAPLADKLPADVREYSDEMLGLMLDEMSPDMATKIGYTEREKCVLITHVRPNSVAHKEGLCAGMVILRVGNVETPTVAEYWKAMNRESLEKGVLVLVGAPEYRHFVVFRR